MTISIALRPSLSSYTCARCLLRQASNSNARSLSTAVSRQPRKAKSSYTFHHRLTLEPTPKGPTWQDYAARASRRSYSNQKKSLSCANLQLAKLTHRRLISLSGQDAPKFLQGLTTNNVDPKTTTAWYSAFLDARGRMMWDTFIYPHTAPNSADWSCYIEVDATEAENLLKHLKRHKLRSKIQIGFVDEGEMGVWAAWTDQAFADANTSLTGVPRELPEGDFTVCSMVAYDFRAPGFGWRLLLRGAQVPGGLSEFLHLNPLTTVVELRSYHLRRYIYGVPEGPIEMPPASALPMESNVDVMHGIDFRKGCYVGQELTIRTKHTGVVRKRILPVQLYQGSEQLPADLEMGNYNSEWSLSTTATHSDNNYIPSGMDIKQLDEDGTVKRGRAAGKFLVGIGNVGLALCRLEMMTDMKVSAEGGGGRPGMQFGIKYSAADGESASQDGQEVRVKAIVPPWLRKREMELRQKPTSKRVEWAEN
ncbi:Aminomethyltransferase folate-binding domain-containing protein [Lepidopterella palustris CBS 459.81]|uniref:Iron-sulfur cluster assembly factor IBA57 homolog, mitochondrial n=1 Tax=Lepidopterella palustris CBS 459.81 TaxID=1314670 RepID=A0A8E2JHK8_9PEZI|nr:Aminomethyltransferase folate-binding domain-containing protein [Lepidopterella palustris CBS 459.81]